LPAPIAYGDWRKITQETLVFPTIMLCRHQNGNRGA
jgi:hypothetical protein